MLYVGQRTGTVISQEQTELLLMIGCHVVSSSHML